MKITISQPDDWVERWKVEAFKKNLDLSAWIAESCNAQLSPEARAKLSERVPRGRPKSTGDDDRYID